MNRDPLELPPLRERLGDVWQFAMYVLVLVVGPFMFFPITKILFGWAIGSLLYLVIRLVARKPLYDYLAEGVEFGLDPQGHVHVLRNQREAFTPHKDWDVSNEMRGFYAKVALWILFLAVISATFVIAAEHWDNAIAVSALMGFTLVLSIAEPLQQVRGRRTFKRDEGGVVLDPVVFAPLFGRYVDSARFDPDDRTPHIDTVLEGALEHLDPAERARMLAEKKERIMARADSGAAAGSLAKLLRVFGG